MKKNITIFIIAIFMLMISVNNVSAKSYLDITKNDISPIYDVLEKDSYSYYAILYNESTGLFRLITFQNPIEYYWDENFSDEWFSSTSTYKNFYARGNSYIYRFNSDFSYTKSSWSNGNIDHKSPWYILECTDIHKYRSSEVIFESYSSLNVNMIKFIDHGLLCDKENVENEYLTLDYTDFFNRKYKYQYKVGNSDWIDITSSFTSLNGYCSVDEDCDLKYDIFVYYNTKIQARVLDSNNEVISTADYDVNNESLMPYMPPKYNTKIKYINDQLRFNLEWYEWPVESSNAQIFLHVIDPDINYTYNYSKYLNSNSEPDFLVNKDSIVELEFGAIVNDNLKIYKKETINIIDLLNLEENSTVKEEFEINNNYNDMKSILDQLKSIINMFKNFLEGFYEICLYLYSKLNKWIKGTIIILIVNRLVFSVVKMMRR